MLFVLTQVPANAQGQIPRQAIDFARYIAGLGLPLAADGRVFLTNAKADQFLGTVVFGLQELLDATFDTIPEVAVAALSAAQQLDWGRKDRLLKDHYSKRVVCPGHRCHPDSVFRRGDPGSAADRHDRAADSGLWRSPGFGATRVAGGSLMLSSGATTAGRWMVSSLLRVVPGATGGDGDFRNGRSEHDHCDGLGVGRGLGEIPGQW